MVEKQTISKKKIKGAAMGSKHEGGVWVLCYCTVIGCIFIYKITMSSEVYSLIKIGSNCILGSGRKAGESFCFIFLISFKHRFMLKGVFEGTIQAERILY